MARKKAQHAEEHVNHERWLITYADMLTLLMVLFIVLFAMSNTDKQKFYALRDSLHQAFNVGVLTGSSNARPKDAGPGVMPTVVQEVMAVTGGGNPDSRMVSVLQELRQAVATVPIPEGSSGHVEVGASREGIVISLAGNILFDSGKADLKPQGLVLLDALAVRLKTMPNEIRVEGHTDNIAIATPLYPSNWELSSARATTVGRYLTEHDGIAPQRMIAAGLGEFRPVAPNDTREGRARNRRVDLVVLFPQMPAQMLAASAPGPRAGEQGALP
ncbi:MAG: OmpA family protein [Chloroflexi bacterium]|nr:OmpA family protein [Chloroflexota bacterium]